MPAQAISIPYDMGDQTNLFPLCTFEDDIGTSYILANAPAEDGLICRRLAYGFWRGTYLCSAAPSDMAVTRAEELLERHRRDADRFPLCGEHYALRRVRTADGSIVRRPFPRGVNALLRPVSRVLPELLHMIVQCFVTALIVFLSAKTPLFGAMLTPLSMIPAEKRTMAFLMICGLATALLFFLRYEDRTFIDYIVHGALPPVLFLQISLIKRSLFLRTATLIAFGMLILFISVPRLIRACRTRNGKKRSGYLRRAVGDLARPLLFVMIASLYITVIFRIPLVTYAEPIDEEAEAVLDEQYRMVLEKLREDVFVGLSPDERLETLRVVADYECRHTLGCTTPDITAGPTGDTTCGYYNDALREVTINEDQLANDSSENLLDTVLHEIRHAYQHQVIKTYMGIVNDLNEDDRRLDFFRYAASITDNNAAYQDAGDDGYAAYYTQAMEEDSRSWAADRFYGEYIAYVYPHYYEEDNEETVLTDGETADTADAAVSA